MISTYYYIFTSNPKKIRSTTVIKDLIELLYENKIDFPTKNQLKILKLDIKYLDKLKNDISCYIHKVPLYDIKSNKVFLIHSNNVYLRIYYNNYRFITKDLFQSNILDKNAIKFLSFYNLKILKNTYYKIFYKSYILNNYITSCRRPSFSAQLTHISPYYTSNELYFLGFDWDLIYNAKLTSNELKKLCGQITQYDIPGKTLLDHQMYIYSTYTIGLVKHYSLYGSYYINSYLRKSLCCLLDTCNVIEKNDNIIRNINLENQINLMINLIKKSPPFIKNHTVYRFIQNDDYIKDLKINDIYTDPSFVSTTRDPFHYQQNYQFGFILMKIKIPQNISGVGLCIESYSNFPYEQEIILPPTSQFRLDNKITNPSSYHHVLNKKVLIKYEMTLIGNSYTNTDENDLNNESFEKLHFQNARLPEINKIDVYKLIQNNLLRTENESIVERLKIFQINYVKNYNNQFISTIGNIDYLFTIESYDSTSVYKQFFYYEVNDGIMITSSNQTYGNINIIIEIGPQIHINYYFRHSVTEIVFDLNNRDWIEWLSILAYIFGIRDVIFHSTHLLHKNDNDSVIDKQLKSRYTYSDDVYQYLKNKKKMYNEDYITPNFDYSQLDYLNSYNANLILNKTERDELYNIYLSSNTQTVSEFYLYVVDNYPQFLDSLESKISVIYPKKLNPFVNISYKLDSDIYLYNSKIIMQIRSSNFKIKKGQFKKLISDDKIFQFKNRLRTYLNS